MKYLFVRTIVMSALLLLIISCKENQIADDFLIEKNKVQFTVIVPKETKTTLGTNYQTAFNVNDAIGIFAVRRTNPNVKGVLTANSNYAQNCQWVFQSNGTWNAATANDEIYYPNNGDKLDFYAYYPYDAGLADPTNIPLTVATNQAATVNFTDNDFLTSINSIGLSIANSANPVSLQFEHKLSLLQLVIIGKQASVPALNSNLQVMLSNVFPNVSINLATNLVSEASGQVSTINMKPMSDGSFYAIVPAQNLAATNTWFEISQGSDFDFKYTFPSVVTTSSAKTTRWDISLGWEVVIP